MKITIETLNTLGVGDHIQPLSSVSESYEIVVWPEQGNDITIRSVGPGVSNRNITYYKSYLPDAWIRVSTKLERDTRQVVRLLAQLCPESTEDINELLVRLEV